VRLSFVFYTPPPTPVSYILQLCSAKPCCISRIITGKVKVLDCNDAWSEGIVAFSNIQWRLKIINFLLLHRSPYYRSFPSGQNVLCTLFLVSHYSLQIIYDIWYICELQLGWHPVAVIQYTLTNKQYTERRNNAEYPERNVQNNKNTYT